MIDLFSDTIPRSTLAQHRAMAIVCVLCCLLIGCSTPPRHHEWEASPENATALQDAAARWRQLSPKDYVRVSDSLRQDAVALLQDHASLKLDSATLSRFAPDLVSRASEASQAYLVRGASFDQPPVYTVLHFDGATGSILVQQFSSNGEFSLPFLEEISEPNALVVVLPRPPEHVYVLAVLDGDGLFRPAPWDIRDDR